MPDADLQSFINAVDKAVNQALREGVAASELELVLQKRAQDMREYAEEVGDET